MIKESDYELTSEEKEQLTKLLERLWTYLNDISRKNDGNGIDIPPRLMEGFGCVNNLIAWVGRGLPLE